MVILHWEWGLNSAPWPPGKAEKALLRRISPLPFHASLLLNNQIQEKEFCYYYHHSQSVQEKVSYILAKSSNRPPAFYFLQNVK